MTGSLCVPRQPEGEERNMKPEGKPSKQFNADAEFGRSYLIGCLVILLAFLIGTALIAYFWLR